MKLFTDTDVIQHGAISDAGKIYADRKELIDSPLDWQKRGLQQTASGYGHKLTTSLKINFNGKLRRIYCTCFSNAGSCWFETKGKRIYVD